MLTRSVHLHFGGWKAIGFLFPETKCLAGLVVGHFRCLDLHTDGWGLGDGDESEFLGSSRLGRGETRNKI